MKRDEKKPHACLRCGHIWYPRTKRRPKACPRCKSYRWDSLPHQSEDGHGKK